MELLIYIHLDLHFRVIGMSGIIPLSLVVALVYV